MPVWMVLVLLFIAFVVYMKVRTISLYSENYPAGLVKKVRIIYIRRLLKYKVEILLRGFWVRLANTHPGHGYSIVFFDNKTYANKVKKEAEKRSKLN